MRGLSIIKIILALLFAVKINISAEDAKLQKPWDYYYKKGLVQIENQMYDYAIENLTKALEGNPALADAASKTADVYIIKNDRIRALDYYKISLKIDDSRADVHFKTASLYDFFFESDLAFFHYRRSAELDPENQYSNINLVRYYLAKKEKDMAEKHFKMAFDAGEKKTVTLSEEIKTALDDDNFELAIKLYSELLDKHPAKMDAYIKISEMLVLEKKYTAASIYLERGKFLKPDYEPAYLHAGRLYFNGKFPGKRKMIIQKALKNFLKAAELNPKNPETYFNLSQIYSALKNDVKAKEMEKKALELD